MANLAKLAKLATLPSDWSKGAPWQSWLETAYYKAKKKKKKKKECICISSSNLKTSRLHVDSQNVNFANFATLAKFNFANFARLAKLKNWPNWQSRSVNFANFANFAKCAKDLMTAPGHKPLIGHISLGPGPVKENASGREFRLK